MNAEQSRLEAARIKKAHWKKWGPYLSEPLDDKLNEKIWR